jgi:hypothetical protein
MPAAHPAMITPPPIFNEDWNELVAELQGQAAQQYPQMPAYTAIDVFMNFASYQNYQNWFNQLSYDTLTDSELDLLDDVAELWANAPTQEEQETLGFVGELIDIIQAHQDVPELTDDEIQAEIQMIEQAVENARTSKPSAEVPRA